MRRLRCAGGLAERHTMTVSFINVGRAKKCWTAELADDSENLIAREARNALMSREVWAEHGSIYAGCRLVGQYRILQPSKSLSE